MKKILIIVAILLVAYMTYNFFNRNVIKSRTIDAPISKVWPQVKNFKNWQHWSPWNEQDTTLKNTYSGIDGTVGSTVSWIGEKAGSGSMTTTSVTENEEMQYHLAFLTPFKSESEGFVKVKEEDGKTIVSWGMINEPGLMVILLNMDMMTGSMFERGLELLEERINSLPKETVTNFEVKKGTFSSIKYAGIKYLNFDIAKLKGQFFGENYGNLMSKELDFNESGIATALYYNWNDENKTTDISIALPINSIPEEEVEGVDFVEIEGESLYIDYYGMYKDLRKVHTAIRTYIIDNNITEEKVAVEEYITDPSTSSNPSDWHTRVSYVNK